MCVWGGGGGIYSRYILKLIHLILKRMAYNLEGERVIIEVVLRWAYNRGL